MEIKTKFNLGDEVWFMYDNRVQKSSIKCIQINVREGDNRNEPFIVTEIEYILFAKTRKEEILYHELTDGEMFKTKEELLKSL